MMGADNQPGRKGHAERKAGVQNRIVDACRSMPAVIFEPGFVDSEQYNLGHIWVHQEYRLSPQGVALEPAPRLDGYMERRSNLALFVRFWNFGGDGVSVIVLLISRRGLFCSWGSRYLGRRLYAAVGLWLFQCGGVALFDQEKLNLGSLKHILMMMKIQRVADINEDCSGQAQCDWVKRGKILNGKTSDVSLMKNRWFPCASGVASCVARTHALGGDCLQYCGRQLPTRALGCLSTF